jgi:cholesterol transport system auxiliary component
MKLRATQAALAIGLLTLASCVSFGGKAPPAMLMLSANNVVASGKAHVGAQTDALVILQPATPRKLDTNRLPVQIDASSIAYLKDALWTDKPSRLLQQLLMEVIAANNDRLVLNEADTAGQAADMISGSLLEFGLDAQTNEAVIIYDAVRIKAGKPIEKRRFEARRPVAEMLPARAGAALNDAANSLAADVSSWVSGNQSKN